jgi:iron complex outermembrane receptor protein
LFGDMAVVTPNPLLKPERGENWDAGVGWSARGNAWAASADYAHFASHVRDLIGYQPGQARTVRATNYGRVEIAGDEVAARLEWRMLALSGSAAWTSARQTDAAVYSYGRRLPLRPERQAAARCDARLGAWRLSADLLDLGEDFLDPINYQRLAPRTIVGVAIARELGPARLTLECKNLGDARISDIAGYPIPGRSLFAALELRRRPDSSSRP